ncbi:cytochrome P450 18a1-like [Ixodes scapularis]|uniref:cytochrome P450 18a1-like n=1 Tax=Ixodes scapularis TaxID=6945 RepID=UPI001C381208|nr:cytochrome P450 18a1-like [Ixodes scapularis]
MSSSPPSQFLWKGIRYGYAVSTMDIILAMVAILILSVLLFKDKSRATDKNKILAPGPKGLPILGYMPFIGPTPHVKYKELSKIYGPIVRVKMGSTDVLVLHDVQSIKEGLNKDEVLARPPYFLLRRMGMDGVITMNGQQWLDNRRFCLHVLRDLGFGRKSMEQHITEEVAQLCDVLQSWGGQPKAITDIITSSISNNITALVFGERFHYDDPRRHFLDTRLVNFALNASFVSTLDFLPILRKLVSYVPSSKIRIAEEQLKDVHDFIRQVRCSAVNVTG